MDIQKNPYKHFLSNTICETEPTNILIKQHLYELKLKKCVDMEDVFELLKEYLGEFVCEEFLYYIAQDEFNKLCESK